MQRADSAVLFLAEMGPVKYRVYKVYRVYRVYRVDLLKTVLGKNSFDKQRHEKIKINDRDIVSKFHDFR